MPEIELFLSPQELEALQALVLQRKEYSVQSLVRRIVREKMDAKIRVNPQLYLEILTEKHLPSPCIPKPVLNEFLHRIVSDHLKANPPGG
jgi:hypothetical protein